MGITWIAVDTLLSQNGDTDLIAQPPAQSVLEIVFCPYVTS